MIHEFLTCLMYLEIYGGKGEVSVICSIYVVRGAVSCWNSTDVHGFFVM